MQLTAEQIREMDADRLRQFLELKIPEGRHVDYKKMLSGDTWEEQKLEFLKDITAFANASGGDVIIGVLEPAEDLDIERQLLGIEGGERVAKQLEGVAASSVDPCIAGLSNSMDTHHKLSYSPLRGLFPHNSSLHLRPMGKLLWKLTNYKSTKFWSPFYYWSSVLS